MNRDSGNSEKSQDIGGLEVAVISKKMQMKNSRSKKTFAIIFQSIQRREKKRFAKNN